MELGGELSPAHGFSTACAGPSEPRSGGLPLYLDKDSSPHVVHVLDKKDRKTGRDSSECVRGEKGA